MRFLYTGSDTYLGEQTDPDNSIGGFCSKSPIPNRKNNLFSDISYLSTFNENEECRAIILENDTEDDIPELFIGYKSDEQLYHIQIAIVELNSEGKMERISNTRDLPYYAKFIDANINEFEDNSVPVEFPVGKKYGIWIKRKIKAQGKKSCLEIEQAQNPDNIINFEFEFKILEEGKQETPEEITDETNTIQ